MYGRLAPGKKIRVPRPLLVTRARARISCLNDVVHVRYNIGGFLIWRFCAQSPNRQIKCTANISIYYYYVYSI